MTPASVWFAEWKKTPTAHRTPPPPTHSPPPPPPPDATTTAINLSRPDEFDGLAYRVLPRFFCVCARPLGSVVSFFSPLNSVLPSFYWVSLPRRTLKGASRMVSRRVCYRVLPSLAVTGPNWLLLASPSGRSRLKT